MKCLGEEKVFVSYQSSLANDSVDSWNLLFGLSVCLSVFVENKNEKREKYQTEIKKKNIQFDESLPDF